MTREGDKFYSPGTQVDVQQRLSSRAMGIYLRCEDTAANLNRQFPQPREHALTQHVVPLVYLVESFRPKSGFRRPLSNQVHPEAYEEVYDFYFKKVQIAAEQLPNQKDALETLLHSTLEAQSLVTEYQALSGSKRR